MSHPYATTAQRHRLFAIVLGIVAAYIVIYCCYLVWAYSHFNDAAETREKEEEERRAYLEREGKAWFEAVMREMGELQEARATALEAIREEEEEVWSSESESGKSEPERVG